MNNLFDLKPCTMAFLRVRGLWGVRFGVCSGGPRAGARVRTGKAIGLGHRARVRGLGHRGDGETDW